ncbi:hypothetical protein NOC27_653 [Nitrosococcus oceani AFC27]|nr:hypothetical protein NOC27_653 [Nitrosococcus oceani AFC27]
MSVFLYLDDRIANGVMCFLFTNLYRLSEIVHIIRIYKNRVLCRIFLNFL